MTVVYRNGQSALDMNAKALALFDRKERTALVKAAFGRAGDAWIDEHLPLRFTWYANKLGYKVTAKYAQNKRKMGVDIPLVYSGSLRESVLNNARAEVVGSTNPTLRLHLGRCWPGMPRQILGTLPGEEAGFIAQQFAHELSSALALATPSSYFARGSRKGQAKGMSLVGAKLTLGMAAERSDRVKRVALHGLQSSIDKIELARTWGTRHTKVIQARLRTWQRWRRTAGGSAGTPGLESRQSQTYLHSRLAKHAQAQRRYRTKQRHLRNVARISYAQTA